MAHLPGVDDSIFEEGTQEIPELGMTFDPNKYRKEPEPNQGLSGAALAALMGDKKGSRRRSNISAGGGGIKRIAGNVYDQDPDFDYEVLYGPDVAGHSGHLHYAAPKGLAKIGRKLQKKGFTISEHSAFDPVDPVHTTGSHHYDDDALDISFNDFTTKWAKKHGIQTEADALSWLKRKLRGVYGDSADYDV